MTVFFDSNILVYSVAADDPRQRVAMDHLAEGGVVSVQVLNEFANVARRKLKMSWARVGAALLELRAILPPPHPISLTMHEAAVELAGRYGFAFYDALIVAAALELKCETLLTKDLQDGMMVRGQLEIRNPFRLT